MEIIRQYLTKTLCFMVIETGFESAIYILTCLLNILKKIPTAGYQINNIVRMIIKINSTKWCNKIKKLFGCSTNNPILCRRNVFPLDIF